MYTCITGGAIGMLGTPVGAVIGAGVGALIGGGIGLVGGVAGGAGTGVGIAHVLRPISLTCTAEDIFQHLELSSNYRREGDRVMVDITDSFTCEESTSCTLIQEYGHQQELRQPR